MDRSLMQWAQRTAYLTGNSFHHMLGGVWISTVLLEKLICV